MAGWELLSLLVLVSVKHRSRAAKAHLHACYSRLQRQLSECYSLLLQRRRGCYSLLTMTHLAVQANL